MGAHHPFTDTTGIPVHFRGDLDAVAARLNARPRKTLGWLTPAERLRQLVPEHVGDRPGSGRGG